MARTPSLKRNLTAAQDADDGAEETATDEEHSQVIGPIAQGCQLKSSWPFLWDFRCSPISSVGLERGRFRG